MLFRSARVLAALTATATVLAACSLPVEGHPQRGSDPAILERVWSVAIDPVSDVVAVDEVAILYSTSANGLVLHGFDAASGV